MSKKTVVGIDVSKNFSNICVLSADDNIVLECCISHNQSGFKYLVMQLKSISKKHLDSVIAVMESTAHYHRILCQYLRKSGIEVIVINPLQSGGTKNLQIRKIKNDKTDAKRLAFLYRMQVLQPTRTDSLIFESLKDLTRQRNDMIFEQTRISNKLTCLLDQSFPDYHKIFSSIRVKSSLSILVEFPTPEAVLSARKDKLHRTMATLSLRRKNSSYVVEKTDALIAAAKESVKISLNRDSFAPLISTFAKLLLDLQVASSGLESTILTLAASDSEIWQSIKLLTSIPGIGEYSAIVILAEIGDIDRFSKPKQLVAYAGLDPTVKQSGTYTKVNNHISKRGSTQLRSVLSVCTHVAIHNCVKGHPGNPVLADFYKEKSLHKPAKVAQTACMHKMVCYIYAVLRDRKSFEIRKPDEHIRIMHEHYNQAA